MSKKKSKGLKSHLNTKSTAKLTKEIEELLEQNIPDPPQPIEAVLEFKDESPEVIEARKRKEDERLVDSIDRLEKNEAKDEYSRRYQ